jgi:hypothetical protein
MSGKSPLWDRRTPPQCGNYDDKSKVGRSNRLTQKREMIMTNIKMGIRGTVIYLLVSGCVLPALALDLDSFTQADRERLVRMETTQTVFMQQMDKRLEQVDKRISNSHFEVRQQLSEL